MTVEQSSRIFRKSSGRALAGTAPGFDRLVDMRRRLLPLESSSRKMSAIRDSAATFCAAELAARADDTYLNQATLQSISREMVMPVCARCHSRGIWRARS